MTSGTFRDLLGELGCVVIPAGDDALSTRIADSHPEHEALERCYADGGDAPPG